MAHSAKGTASGSSGDLEVYLCMHDGESAECAFAFVPKRLSSGCRMGATVLDSVIPDSALDDTDLAGGTPRSKRGRRPSSSSSWGTRRPRREAGSETDAFVRQKAADLLSPSSTSRKLYVDYSVAFKSKSSTGGVGMSGVVDGLSVGKSPGKALEPSRARKAQSPRKRGRKAASVREAEYSNSGLSLSSPLDSMLQASSETPRSNGSSSSKKLQDPVLDTSLEDFMSKLSGYKFEKPGSEFLQSYVPASADVFGLGTLVTPTRKDISMCHALSEIGDMAGLRSFERTLYQTAVLRSRAFGLSWDYFMRRVNDIIGMSVHNGAQGILELLKSSSASDPLLQLIIADVGVMLADKSKVLDILIDALKDGKKQNIVVKAKLSNTIQSCLEHIYIQLKVKASSSRSQGSDRSALEPGSRKNIFQEISELYKWRLRNRRIVIVVDKISQNLCEFLYILQLLKNREGLLLSCILCSNCWQTNLEQHVSLRVYYNLSIVNCDVLSVNKVSEEILKILLFDSEVQCFFPHLVELEVIWNTLYDDEMSLNGLIKRIYSMYENFYRSSQFSFVCMPNIIDIKAKVWETAGVPPFGIEADESLGRLLHSRLGLLFCGACLSASHGAYLQLLLDKEASLEALCLHVLPYEAMRLFERRLSMQLGTYILYELMACLPDHSRTRDRLALLSATFHSDHMDVRLPDLIKRISRTIGCKTGPSLSNVFSIMRRMGSHFLAVYSTITTLNSYMSCVPKHDLIDEYLRVIGGSSASSAATFVEHALMMLLVPAVHTESKLGHHMMVAKFHNQRHDWNVLRDMLTKKECTGFANDLKHLIKLSQAILARNINLWDLFCLFYSHFSRDGLASVFIRFTMALDTLTHILGYYSYTPVKTSLPLGLGSELSGSVELRLANAIKAKLSRFKVKRIHMGKFI